MAWDGVIKHKARAGLRGYKVWGCRCDQGCADAGIELAAKRREQERARREEARAERAAAPQAFRHGLSGYRRHDCRCDLCVLAYAEYRERDRSELPLPDWSELEHLKPGYGVKRRV